GADDVHHRAPVVDDPARGSDRGAAGRKDRRGGAARRVGEAGMRLCSPAPPPVGGGAGRSGGSRSMKDLLRRKRKTGAQDREAQTVRSSLRLLRYAVARWRELL